jgi:hypothetical protein
MSDYCDILFFSNAIRTSLPKHVVEIRKLYLLLSLLGLFSATAFCSPTDSLHKKLTQAEGVQKVEVYIALARLSKNSEEGYRYGYNALKLSSELKHHVGIANSLLIINKFNIIEEKHSETVKNAFRALHLKEELHLETVSHGLIYHQLATSLKDIGAYSDAIHYKKKQLKWKIAKTSEDSLNLYYLISQLAELYYKTKAYDSALVYYKNGLDVTIGINNLRYEGSSYDNIALVYQELNRLDSAWFYFQKAEHIYAYKAPKTNENYNMLGIVKGNLGSLLPNSDTRKAHYLLSDIRYNYAYEKGIHLVKAYLAFADYNLAILKHRVAKNYLDAANALFVLKKFSNSSVSLKMSQLYLLYYIQTYQADKAKIYFANYNYMYDSLYGKNAVQELINSRSTYELIKIENELTIERIEREKKEAEILALKNEKVISNLKNTLLLGGGLMIITIAILLILKSRSKLRKVTKETALEKRLLEQELDYGSKLLIQSSLGLKRKMEFAEELTSRVFQLEIVNSSEKQALKLFISNELDVDGSMIEMEKFISEIGRNFFIRLKQLHPNLTDNEVKLIILCNTPYFLDQKV